MVDGVTFSFTTNGQFRSVGTWGNGILGVNAPWALEFGGSGGNPASFVLTVSQDIILNTFTGLAQEFLVNPVFDVSGQGVASVGNTFNTVGFLASTPAQTQSFNSGALSLTAGSAYTFQATNSGSTTSGFFTELDFDKSMVSPVPLPAGLPLALLGLGALGALRRRKT